jgi:hypothetical protein
VEEGYGFYPTAADARFNLAGVSIPNQSVLTYVPGCSLAAAQGVIFEYSSQARAEKIDFVAEAIYVANTAPREVQLTCVPCETLPDSLLSLVKGALGLADFVEFEDGMENEFTLRIINLVNQHGRTAVDTLVSAMFRPDVRPEVIAQTLLCFARVDDEASIQARSRALRRGLLSPSAVVRDAATIGVAALEDMRAIADLVSAIATEKIRGLREDMQAALSYLQSMK